MSKPKTKPTKSSSSPSALPYPSAHRPSLDLPSTSFRLRSPSLNSVRLRRIFDLFDHNGDGEITLSELSLALDRLGLGADPDDLSFTIASHIRPGQSGLDFSDFEGLHSALGQSLSGDVDDFGDASEESWRKRSGCLMRMETGSSRRRSFKWCLRRWDCRRQKASRGFIR